MFQLESLQQLAMSVFGAEKNSLEPDFLKLKKGQQTLSAIIARHYQRYDDAISTDPEPIACKSGCNYCCHYHVYVTPIEVFGMAEWARTKLPADVQAEVKQRLSDGIQQIAGLTVDQHIAKNVRCCGNPPAN